MSGGIIGDDQSNSGSLFGSIEGTKSRGSKSGIISGGIIGDDQSNSGSLFGTISGSKSNGVLSAKI